MTSMNTNTNMNMNMSMSINMEMSMNMTMTMTMIMIIIMIVIITMVIMATMTMNTNWTMALLLHDGDAEHSYMHGIFDHLFNLSSSCLQNFSSTVMCVLARTSTPCRKTRDGTVWPVPLAKEPVTDHRANGAPGGALTPSGCCNPTAYARPRAACPRR